MSIISQVINHVREADARARLPPEARGTGVYSAMTVWHFVSENTNGNQCPHCKQHNNHDILGSMLRSLFPDHIVISPTQIYANIHMTLWGRETCYCYLWRDADLYNPETLFGENPP